MATGRVGEVGKSFPKLGRPCALLLKGELEVAFC